MSEDVFRELLRSPIPEKGSPAGGRAAAWGWFSVAALVGALGTFAVMWIGGGGAEEEASVVTSTTTAPEVEPALPAGYLPLGGGGYGVRPELAFVHDDGTYLVMSTAVRSDLDPEATGVFTGGQWALRAADGTTVAYRREIHNPESLGVFAIEFPAGTSLAGDATLELLPALPREAATVETVIDVPGLPWQGPLGPIAFPHADGIEVVFDAVDVGPEGGVIAWRLGNRVDATATVTPAIVLDGAGVLLPAWSAPPAFNQLPPPPAPAPAHEGVVTLHRQGDPVDPAGVDSITVRLEVTWQYHQTDAVEIPLGDVAAAFDGR